MKKIVVLAAFAVMGVAVVSCSSDDNEIQNLGSVNDFNTETAIYTEAARDSVPVTTIPPGEGPGDDPIIILPPKKP